MVVGALVVVGVVVVIGVALVVGVGIVIVVGVGLAFGFFLLWASFGIIKESLAVFLEAAPKDTDLLAVKRDIDALPGVVRTHHMHAWSLASGRNIFSAHVFRNDDADPDDLLVRILRMPKEQYGFYFTTVQIESSEEGEEGAEGIEFLRHEKFVP
jgi:cobalt-zinc-cadmium efflux system protein